MARRCSSTVDAIAAWGGLSSYKAIYFSSAGAARGWREAGAGRRVNGTTKRSADENRWPRSAFACSLSKGVACWEIAGGRTRLTWPPVLPMPAGAVRVAIAGDERPFGHRLALHTSGILRAGSAATPGTRRARCAECRHRPHRPAPRSRTSTRGCGRSAPRCTESWARSGYALPRRSSRPPARLVVARDGVVRSRVPGRRTRKVSGGRCWAAAIGSARARASQGPPLFQKPSPATQGW
jgi:hypothetical protein